MRAITRARARVFDFGDLDFSKKFANSKIPAKVSGYTVACEETAYFKVNCPGTKKSVDVATHFSNVWQCTS